MVSTSIMSRASACYHGRKIPLHYLAEVYSVTGMPGKNRASPDEAMLFLRDVCDRLTTVTPDDGEYFHVLEDVAASGTIGALIRNAIIAHCALKAKAQIEHFNRPSGQIASRVREP